LKILIAASALVTAISAAPSARPTELASLQPDLTREQARERADQLFDRFDLNGDGIVTRYEAQHVGKRLLLLRAATGRDVAPGIGGHTLRFLKHRFAGAHSIRKRDLEDAILAHFDEMDRDHDGILTAAERVATK
jgi:Ca2+-binding EF-hand superfamily protein